jgi:hypothetical protein
MKIVEIEQICIEYSGSLSVTPKDAEFPYVYREAMDIQWDSDRKCLFSPIPREWTYLDWFKQIRAAAVSQGVTLVATENTRWSNIKAELMEKFLDSE